MPAVKVDQTETYTITGEQIATVFAALADIDRVRGALTDGVSVTDDSMATLQRATDGVYHTLNGLPRSRLR